VASLAHELILVEQRMIPLGLHVLGKPPVAAELADILALVATFYKFKVQCSKLNVGSDQAHSSELITLNWLIAAGLGWDYEGVRDRLKTNREAQVRWERIDEVMREAMHHFVGANERGFWDADDATLEALQNIYGDLEDRLEGVAVNG
jgi:magnesium chelatase subunit H